MTKHPKKNQPTHPPKESASSDHKQRQRKKSRNRLQRILSTYKRRIHYRTTFIFFCTVVVVGTIVMIARFNDATSNLDASWQRLERVLQSIENRKGTDLTFDDFYRVSLSVTDLHRNIRSTRQQLGLFEPLITLNSEWEISYELLDIAYQLTSATRNMLEGLEPVIELLEENTDRASVGLQISTGERMVDFLEIGQEQFLQASDSLESANISLESIDLSSVTVTQALNFQQMDNFHQQLTSINSSLVSSHDILGQLMGLKDEATYLVLAQNNDAIRPSGGQITAYGWFNVRNGYVIGFDYSESSTTSPIPPNESFRDTFEIPPWWIDYEDPLYAAWDGSWNVDFPSTAQRALEYYNSGNNVNAPVDGVIAVDLHSLEQIFNILVQVNVPGFDKTVTTTNFRNDVYDVHVLGDQGHGKYFAAIYRGAFEKLQGIGQTRSADLLSILIESLSQRHIMIYSSDEDTQAVINQIGWSGSQASGDSHDYILVADANLSNKSNHSIIRSFSYDVEILEDQSLINNLRLRYDYFDSVARPDRAINTDYYGIKDYTTLTQIYLPSDIMNLDEEDLSQFTVDTWNNYTLVISQLDVHYDTSKQVQLSYETPARIDQIGDIYRYRVLIQKQPGALVQDMNIQITLPENATILSSSPNTTASYALEQPVLDFRLQFVADQWIEVLYSLD